MKKEKYKKIKTVKIKKGISTICKKEWDEFYGKDNWERIYSDEPLSSLNFRNGLEHIIFGCTTSGTSFYGENEHCGGCDHISYSIKDNIFKIDRFAIIPNSDPDKLEIVMLNKKSYKEIHHITTKEDLIKEYPHLKVKI